MKKALSLILSLVMVLTLIPMAALPAFAEGETTVSENPVINVYDKVVPETDSTGVTFVSLIEAHALAADTTYVLQEDIDLTGVTVGSVRTNENGGQVEGEIALASGVVLDGNGYAIKNLTISVGKNSGLFNGHSSGTVTIKDITFGTKEAPMVFTHDGGTYNNAKAFGLVIGTQSDATINFTNVSTYVTANYTAGAWQEAAVFIARNWGTANFTNCVADGGISANGFIGAFVGDTRNKTLTFTNCVNNIDITAKNTQSFGGFVAVAKNASNLTFIDCVNNGDVAGTGARQAGGFVGDYQGTGTVSFTNCINSGYVTHTNNSGSYNFGAGGFVGVANNASAKINIANSVNNGEIKGVPAAGGFVGCMGVAGATVTITDSVNTGKVWVTGGHAGGAIGKADVVSGKITVSRFFGTGYVESTSSAGGIVGRAEATGNTGMEITISDSVVTGNVKGKWNAGAATGYLATAKTILKNNISTANVMVDDVTSTSQHQCAFINISSSAVCDYENNYYLNECEMDATGATKVTLGEIVNLINAKTEFVDTFGKFTINSEGTNVVVATPAFAGYQLGTIGADNKYSVRFLATIDDVKLADPCEYTVLGMEFGKMVDGEFVSVKYTNVANVYTSVMATENGEQIAVTAEKLGGKYIFAVIGENFDATKDLNMVVRTYAEGADGVRYYGDTYAVSVPAQVK